MNHPASLRIHDYSYELPPHRIAVHPLEERDSSKLLVYRNGVMTETVYRQLPGQLRPETLLLFNNTRVVEARIFFRKPTGGQVELFCLEPAGALTVEAGMCTTTKVRWNCLVRGAARWKEGLLEKVIEMEGSPVRLYAELVERSGDHFVVEFSWHPAALSFGAILHAAGVIPLPPYLHRNAEASDYERYQTVYARREGSVAAPTAGLHFTDALLQQINGKGIVTDFVTLHVGAGTFQPVKSDTIGQHTMHREWIQVQKSTIEHIINLHPYDVIPVGTTSLRTVESLYWMGRKALLRPDSTVEELAVQQWDPYDTTAPEMTAEQALQALLAWLNDRQLDELVCTTQLMIAPGYRMRIADALITNFHQPNSTLLLLVAALVGDDWRKVYAYALENDFRFLSYGDGSLLWGSPVGGRRTPR
ncbi:MAG TPA: S-adenosylmethionine:tRNA ribosyltransferase-isomerase [Lacibacter sp.]|nr:S-adenosylmethionine:tRNA ribosyltransferase-isomerase [Lacibacter sp.]HMO88814.1 S-adenosylmethionine:tRNA ribosyltransferase-isomerase [Lacibacter sp.]